MDCPATDLLVALATCELPSDRFEQMDEHVQGCPRCQRILDGLEAVDGQFDKAIERELTDYADEPELTRLMDQLGGSGTDVPVRSDEKSAGFSLTQLGEFRIVREIGRGGMGVVYEAVQPSLRRTVALKVLPLASALSPQRKQRFENEARAAALMSHEHIAPVYAVGEEDGVHYFAMLYIEGRTLAKVVEDLRRIGLINAEPGSEEFLLANQVLSGQAGPVDDAAVAETKLLGPQDTHEISLPPEAARPGPSKRLPGKDKSRTAYFRKVASLGIQAARALECAHHQGIIHRDIKPSNLMLDECGKLWVIDFGLAHIKSESRLSMSGDLLGTLPYMSAEQIVGPRGAVDHRTDVYSLGATLYELATLTPLFVANSRAGLLDRVLSGQSRPARAVWDAIPVDLETIILKSTANLAPERYATAGELAADLTRFLNHEPIQAKRPGWIDRSVKLTQRNPVAFALSLGMVAIVVVAAMLWVMGLTVHNERLSQLVAELDRTNDQLAGSVRSEKSARRLAQQRELTALQHRYPMMVQAAARALGAGNPRHVREILNGLLPEESQPDLRGFEWSYLDGFTRRKHVSYQLPCEGNHVAFSAAAGTIAVAADDGGLYLVDPETMRLKQVIQAGQEWINAVAFSPDGTKLASAAEDSTVKVWDLERSGALQAVIPHPHRVFRVLFTRDGSQLITGGDSPVIRIFSVAGELLRSLEGHTGDIDALALSPDGKLLASAGDDHTGRIWSLASGATLRTFEEHERRLTAIAFAPDNQTVATGAVDMTVRVWDVSGEPGTIAGRHLDVVLGVVFSPDGERLFACDRGGVVHEWPLPSAPLPTAPSLTKDAVGSSWLAHTSRAYTLTITPDGERVISTGQDGMLHVWDPAIDGRRQLLDDPQHSGDGGDFAVIPGTSALAVTGWGQLRTWNPETLELSPPAPLAANSWDRLAASPDGKTIAVANSDDEDDGREGVIAILNRDDWSVRRQIRHGGVAACWSLDYSPDGSLLGAIVWPKGKPDVLWLFDAASGQRLPEFAVPHCNCFAFSPVTGLIAASRENHVLVYNVDRLEIVCDLHGHYDTVDDVAFSHDGTLLATSGSRDVILWDARDGREIRRLTGFTTSHNFLAFAADDRSLVTGGEDGVIRVWHVATGEHMFDLGTLPHAVDKIGLSQDGQRFLCLSHQNQIVVFNTSPAAATTNDSPSPDTATSQRR